MRELWQDFSAFRRAHLFVYLNLFIARFTCPACFRACLIRMRWVCVCICVCVYLYVFSVNDGWLFCEIVYSIQILSFVKGFTHHQRLMV